MIPNPDRHITGNYGEDMAQESEPEPLLRLQSHCNQFIDEYGSVWVRDSYTGFSEYRDDCVVCGRPIEDEVFLTNLDGGESVHWDCVEVWQ